MDFYDKQGNVVDVRTWGQWDKAVTDKGVAETTLPDGKWVSTVLDGIDMGFGDGPPLIFETMVFRSEEALAQPVEIMRYATLAEAQAGHAAMVAKWLEEEKVQ